MAEGLSNELLTAAACAALVSALIAARVVWWLPAVTLAGIRVAIPLGYFAWYYDAGSSTSLVDDLAYVANARALLARGYNPLSVLAEPSGWDLLHSLSNGHHVLYAWWNLLAMWLFGEHYYCAVFLNVVATFASGYLLFKLATLLGFPVGYGAALFAFWMLHWDAIAWSSFLNLKDVLVQTLTVAGLYALVGYFTRRQLRYLAGMALLVPLFWWLRFYVPLLMGAAALVWMITQWHDWRRLLLVPPCAIACLLAWMWLGDFNDYFSFDSVAYGIVRFSLTPIPWNLDDDYGFLAIPSVLHWLFFLPAAAGGLILWIDSKPARLLLLYALCLVCLYAVTEELLGPRQRFQTAFVFAWAQFHACWLLKKACAAPGVAIAQHVAAQPAWNCLPASG